MVTRFLFCVLCVCCVLMLFIMVGELEMNGQSSKHLGSKSQSSKIEVDASISQAKQSINDFLTRWLVFKDSTKSISFFAKEAFENRAILSETCAGYIKTESRSNPKAVERGVRKFLSDFNTQVAGLVLGDILTTEGSLALTESSKTKLINTPDKDKFWLFRFSPVLLKELGAEIGEQRFQMEGKNALVSIIKLRLKIDGELSTGILYFLWLPEKTEWQVFHVGLICQ